MQVLIKLPDTNITKDIIQSAEWEDGSLFDMVLRGAIKNATILPKGHGRIGDLDKLIKAMKERNDDNGGEPLNAVDKGYDLAYQHMVEEAKDCIIIEADKA